MPENGQKTKLPPKSQVDLQALAERIVQLMKKEARLELDRVGQSKTWGKR